MCVCATPLRSDPHEFEGLKYKVLLCQKVENEKLRLEGESAL